MSLISTDVSTIFSFRRRLRFVVEQFLLEALSLQNPVEGQVCPGSWFTRSGFRNFFGIGRVQAVGRIKMHSLQ